MRRPHPVCTALFAVALTAGLVGCGSSEDDTPERSSATVDVLSEQQLASILLSPDDLGTGFRVDEDDDEDDDSSLGCLDDAHGFDDIESETDLDRNLEADTEFALPGVLQTAGSFATVAEAKHVLELTRAEVADCRSVDETDEDGARFQLELSTTDDTVSAAVDEQLTVIGTGTVTFDPLEVPMSVRITAIRVANHLALVGYVDMHADGPDVDEASRGVADAVASRLLAVVAGKPVPKLDPLDLEATDLGSLFANAT